jgi:muconolactone D-isomerase
MEFLVEFEVHVPAGTPEAEVKERRSAEAAASARLGRQGRLVRLWRPAAKSGKAVGLYRADSAPDLDSLLSALPMHDWMDATVTQLDPHPNDPGLLR